MLPPPLRVAVTRGLGEPAQGIGSDIRHPGLLASGGRFSFVRPALRVFQRHLVRLGQVHEAHGGVVGQAVLNRLPLGREQCERIVDSPARLFGNIDQQRNRRLHLRVSRERKQLGRVGRTFDEQRVRLQVFERGPQTARRAGAVMPYTEDMQVHHSSSLQAR